MDAKEIEAAADALLSEAGISYKATLVQRGAIAPPAEKGGKGWEHDAWRITFSRDGRTMETSYKTGTGHRVSQRGGFYDGKPLRPGTLAWKEREGRKVTVPPKVAGVLYSYVMDDTQGESFESWADNFGYDSDNRKALETYMLCQRQTDEARRFFGNELWRRIQTIVEGY